MNVTIQLKRDCPAIQIPNGQSVILPAGATVEITQTLGGASTVAAQGGLFRVAAKDADALGNGTPATPVNADGNGPVVEELVWQTLKDCYDPEIPINIVDLGLVYDMQISPLPTGKSRVDVKMTLTAPGCGMGGVIAGDAQQRLLQLPGVGDASVDIVWDPPWHQSMITAEGRKILGIE
jgi:probable FeS assembly SUF system protein SufT